MDNAIKYTREGGNVTVLAANQGNERVLEVRDTGIGIPPDALPHIFERFYRADPSRNGSNEGAGLGLSLVQWIVDRHGGRIEVKSKPGEGSYFTVRLPAAMREYKTPGIPRMTTDFKSVITNVQFLAFSASFYSSMHLSRSCFKNL